MLTGNSGSAAQTPRPRATPDLAVSPTQSVSLTQLFTLGITGGIIPCPAALIVLLSAFALHRIGLGFFLIVAFSVGLASVLIGFGMLMVYARRFMTRLQIDGPLTKRWLPVASSSFITVLGLTLAIQSLASVHLDTHLLSRENLGPILFVTGLGLVLGMRHSTDADHVVAISTIVSKQRSIRNAAVIGSVWGLGHTITIFIVGSLIILFGVEIPPRLGLSMEFSVAIMLVLLGVLNLTGVMQKVTAWFTPAIASPKEGVALEPSKSAAHRQWRNLFENSVGRLGVYQCVRPSGHRACSRTCRIRGRCSACSLHDSQPRLGDGIPAHLWRRHHGWNDVHDSHDCRPTRIRWRPLCQTGQVSGSGFGDGEPLFRLVSRLPTRISGRPVYEPPSMDSPIASGHSYP